ncbi:MAG: hypothetical protein MZV70_40930 [Desulfobacterales bacterium]|nr:hypothetical protein [Desulfobacterales bacterium]
MREQASAEPSAADRAGDAIAGKMRVSQARSPSRAGGRVPCVIPDPICSTSNPRATVKLQPRGHRHARRRCRRSASRLAGSDFMN